MTIDLDSFPIVERTRWWMLLMGLAAVFAKLWELLSMTNHSGMMPIIGIIMVFTTTVWGLQKKCSLDGTSHSITYQLVSLDYKSIKNAYALPSCWVQLELAGTYQNQQYHSKWNSRIRNNAIIQDVIQNGKKSSSCRRCCSQVAHLLGIENKSYKGLA